MLSNFLILSNPGSQYWVFKDTEAMSGYPRPLSDWGMRTESGAPVDRVDAGFVWAHNGKTYLFSGGMFWRFDESRKDDQAASLPEPGYPRDNGLWEGMPNHMDDVISWGEGNTAFRHIMCHRRLIKSTDKYTKAKRRRVRLITLMSFRSKYNR